MFWFFGHEACGILAPLPGIKPTTPALDGEVLPTGLPGKSWVRPIFRDIHQIIMFLLPSNSYITFTTWCKESIHWKRPWCWERLRAGGEGGDRGWDGWIASPTQWTWVWAKSERQWRTERSGVLVSRESQRIRHDLVTKQQWVRVALRTLDLSAIVWTDSRPTGTVPSYYAVYWTFGRELSKQHREGARRMTYRRTKAQKGWIYQLSDTQETATQWHEGFY